MAENGSPSPELESDEDRSYFLIRLPVHARAARRVAGRVTGEVTGEVERLLVALTGEMQRRELQDALGLKHEDHFRNAYLVPALEADLVEMTIPDKPRSSKQRYRLTNKGRLWLTRAGEARQGVKR
jgi:ATP-dependent DNA helicase RecG